MATRLRSLINQLKAHKARQLLVLFAIVAILAPVGVTTVTADPPPGCTDVDKDCIEPPVDQCPEQTEDYLGVIDGCPEKEPPTEDGFVPPSTDCPTADVASMIIAGNETALVSEGGEICLFEWRAPPLSPDRVVECPDVDFVNRAGVESLWTWECEMDIAGMENFGLLAYGGSGSYEIDAGSFRPIEVYLAVNPNDPIADPCTSLENKRSWIRETGAVPNWPINPANFTCPGRPTPVDPGNGDDGTANVCPPADRPGRVASLVGGRAGEWQWLVKLGVWKRISSRAADLNAPWGTLDWWDGNNAHMGTKSADNAFEATWNC